MAITVESQKEIPIGSPGRTETITVDSTDDGVAIILRSPKPALITHARILNDDASAADVDCEVYASPVDTGDPDSDWWELVSDDPVSAAASGGTDPEGVNICAQAVMLLVKSAASGVPSEGVRAALTAVVNR